MAIGGNACAILLSLVIPAAATVTLAPGLGKVRWQRLSFSDSWNVPPAAVPEVETHRVHLAFRLQSDSLLVALAQSNRETASVISSNQYAVDLQRGLVRRATAVEWDAAKRIATHADSPFREPPVIQGDAVSFSQRRFHASGKIIKRYALSPDGSWLAVMSYSLPRDWDASSVLGLFWGASWRALWSAFDRKAFREHLFVDVYEVATGVQVGKLSGDYYLDPEDEAEEILDKATWISDRYLVVPGLGNRGAMLGDMRAAAPPSETAWDFIETTAEIIGVREEPKLSGYDDLLNSIRIHATVRVP
jgi:hypothetical protein